MRNTLGMVALVVLAGCLGNVDGIELRADDPPRTEVAAAKTACEADGGSYGRGGLFADLMCFKPYADAGQACKTEADCAGMCMVEDGTRQCQALAPQFGCYEYVEDDGQVIGICVD